MNDILAEKVQETLSGVVTLLEKIETLISKDGGYGKMVSTSKEMFESMNAVNNQMLSMEETVNKNFFMAMDCFSKIKESTSFDMLGQIQMQVVELALKTNADAFASIYSNLHNFQTVMQSGIEWNSLPAEYNLEDSISRTSVGIMDLMKDLNEQ